MKHIQRINSRKTVRAVPIFRHPWHPFMFVQILKPSLECGLYIEIKVIKKMRLLAVEIGRFGRESIRITSKLVRNYSYWIDGAVVGRMEEMDLLNWD